MSVFRSAYASTLSAFHLNVATQNASVTTCTNPAVIHKAETDATETSTNKTSAGKEAIETIIIVFYCLPLLCMLLFALVQTQLAVGFWWNRRKYEKENKNKAKEISEEEGFIWPTITIQLPVYNELYVIERLLDSVVLLDYDKSKVEIQVLDDSNDETVQIIADKIEELRPFGWDIKHVRREERVGFKAGALAYGLTVSKGEFVAIFDADFQPHSDFLKKTVPFFFEDSKIGVVQTRWAHMNKNYSFLTQMQALALDGHFVVEQMSRCMNGHFLHFNGTAGLWRRECIADAGGWSADTLTEDLDLSFRAQLKDWKFKYLGDITTPAELPVAMNAMRTQQFRWMKGPAQCAVKNLPRVFKSKEMSIVQKINAISHLLNSGIYIWIFIFSIMSIPFTWVQFNHNNDDITVTSLFLHHILPIVHYVNIGLTFGFFWLSYEHTRSEEHSFLRNIAVCLVKLPFFVCFYLGMTLHNGLAAIEGYRGKKSAFIRTVKFGDGNNSKNNKKKAKNVSSDTVMTTMSKKSNSKNNTDKNWKKNTYVAKEIKSVPKLAKVEAFISLLFLASVILGFYFGATGSILFHIMGFLGYGMVSGLTFLHAYRVPSVGCCDDKTSTEDSEENASVKIDMDKTADVEKKSNASQIICDKKSVRSGLQYGSISELSWVDTHSGTAKDSSSKDSSSKNDSSPKLMEE